jgi:tRNA modification GTPase
MTYRGKQGGQIGNRVSPMNIWDTIAAISTPIGEGGIGIVRISGEKALSILAKIFQPRQNMKDGDWESHRLYYGNIVSAAAGQIIDEVLVSVMRAPRTYTREDVVEINCHGGIVPVRRIFREVTAQGARIAEPGEFTKRAFLNGRIDLAQAEAVIDVIRAKTDRSLQVALQQLDGELSAVVGTVQNEMLSLLSQIEATIDYPESEVSAPSQAAIREKAISAKASLERLLASSEGGKILREGLKIAIVGKPNVGKSSLLNALLREQRAIVTAVPGTTRDLIEENLSIQGIPLRLVDTAGIRTAADEVERIGIGRSDGAIQTADLILFVLDNTTGITDEDREIARRIGPKECLILLNKIDILRRQISYHEVRTILPGRTVMQISALTGEGVSDLEAKIADTVFRGRLPAENMAVMTNIRHIHAVETALAHVREIIGGVAKNVPIDLLAIDIRAAWESLGKITGSTVTENILDEIFTKFCIGK